MVNLLQGNKYTESQCANSTLARSAGGFGSCRPICKQAGTQASLKKIKRAIFY